MTRILFVDNDQNLLVALAKQCRDIFDVDVAYSEEAGLARFKSHPHYAVVVTDFCSSQVNGIRFLTTVKRDAPTSVRMVLTGHNDIQSIVDGVNLVGAYRLLLKPCSTDTVHEALHDGIEYHKSLLADKQRVEHTLHGSIKAFTQIITLTDPIAVAERPFRTAIIRKLARELSVQNVADIELAAMLLPIGSVVIPTPLLIRARTGAELDDVQTRLLEQIPAVSRDVLGSIPQLQRICELILHSGCKFEGASSQGEVSGEAIPLGARILKIACDFAALRLDGYSESDAVSRLSDRRGWYDPRILGIVCKRHNVEAEGPEPGEEGFLVTLSDLQVGQILLQDLRTDDSRLLLPLGTVLSEVYIKKIRTYARMGRLARTVHVCGRVIGGCSSKSMAPSAP